MQLSTYPTYNSAFQLQRARRGRRRQVAADGWQGARVWGDTGAHGEHWTALARADAYFRLGVVCVCFAGSGSLPLPVSTQPCWGRHRSRPRVRRAPATTRAALSMYRTR